jgi:NhaA family Na+:H+ antiporter
LLGSRISRGLVIFLVALAIADDLGAVMVIAVFYSADISHFYLVMSGLIFVSLVGINILGYQNPVPYVLLGIILWIMVFLSGVHATLAGVLLALTIPARSRTDTDTFLAEAQSVIKEFECAGSCGYSVYTNEDHQAAVHTLETMCHRVEPPLLRIEYTFHPWVVFLIIPLFGLANAGVRLDPASLPQMLASPVALGVGLGLFLGKQLGIVVASFLALRAGIAALPSGATPGQVYGGAVLCGIGFTMSLFVNDLAFGAGPAADMGKIAIFAGSVLSFVVGMTVLFVTTGTKRGGSESTGMENDSLSRSPGAYA